MSWFDFMKSGYSRKRKNIGDYEIDRDLSNDNQQVYYNKKTNKMMFNVSGTHNWRDWGTDLWLAFGGLKKTNRYKEADRVYKKARDKYKGASRTVTGHSLGGAIAGYVSKPEDRVYTYNKGATIGQKMRKNERHYRTAFDVVSALTVGKKHSRTLFRGGYNPIDAHDLRHIRYKRRKF